MSAVHSRFVFIAVGAALAMFAGMLVFLEIGRRFANWQVERHGQEARTGVGIVDSAVYGLLALLIGFSFSGAATRFDARRVLIGREVDAVGTAWRRLDLLPPETRTPLQNTFRHYVDVLITSYTAPPASRRELLMESPDVARAESDLWTQSVAATLAEGGEPARMLLLPSVDDMFGIVLEEQLARRIHPPGVIFTMLGITALAASLFAGYGLASKSIHNWIFMVGIAATVSMAVYVIVELEYPRLGIILVNDMDRALIEFRATMK